MAVSLGALPTRGQKSALVGTSGSPGSVNPFVTSADPTHVSSFGGDGTLGDVTIASNGSAAGVFNYNNLTINTGVTLTVPTFRALHIKCAANFTMVGTATIDARNFTGPGGTGALSGTPPGAAGATPVTQYAHSAGGGGGGGAGSGLGGGTNGGNGGDRDTALFDGAGHGTGGAGGGTNASGSVAVVTSAIGSPYAWLKDLDPPAGWSLFAAPGACGGGGGGSNLSGGGGGASGGNGGAGGGIVLLEILGVVTIPGTAFIFCGGSAGANGVAGGSSFGGGGGGGGGGGTLEILYVGTSTLSGTLSVAGGAGGAGGGSGIPSGAIGSAGENGYLRTIKVAA